MNAREAIRLSLDTGHMVFSAYLEGLSDADLMRRASPGINHINWQVGHLILAEHQMVGRACPGSMPALPAGFAEKYSKETAGSDNASQFCSKAELLKAAAEQRAATLGVLANLSDADLDREIEVFGRKMSVGGALTGLLLGNTFAHTGEISALKGLHGAKGYPF